LEPAIGVSLRPFADVVSGYNTIDSRLAEYWRNRTQAGRNSGKLAGIAKKNFKPRCISAAVIKTLGYAPLAMSIKSKRKIDFFIFKVF
jgi:hypothetical protein